MNPSPDHQAKAKSEPWQKIIILPSSRSEKFFEGAEKIEKMIIFCPKNGEKLPFFQKNSKKWKK